MRLLSPLLFLLGAATTLLATDNGLTTAVTWDQYSLLINNERVWIFAGEFHYERLPVPELWRDVLQKFKANGLNAVNTYFFWSYHSASRGALDFETAGKDVQRLFDIAREEGLWVVARPGPYVNAETSAGGLALWTTDGSGGEYRTADERFYEVSRGGFVGLLARRGTWLTLRRARRGFLGSRRWGRLSLGTRSRRVGRL